jgi:hypothetical protein
VKVGRALVEVTAGTLATVVPYYTDDIEYHDPVVDVYGIYSATWTMVGTFAGVPYEAKGMSIIRFRDKSTSVYYQRDYYTEGDIMIAVDPLKPAVERPDEAVFDRPSRMDEIELHTRRYAPENREDVGHFPRQIAQRRHPPEGVARYCGTRRAWRGVDAFRAREPLQFTAPGQQEARVPDLRGVEEVDEPPELIA